MSIHILVPQERLAELFKQAYELELLNVGGVGNWSNHYVALNEPEEGRESLDAYKSHIDHICRMPGGLGRALNTNVGYQYTVDTDAAYFENLEDMLDAEE